MKNKEDKEAETSIAKIMANPFYCVQVAPIMVEEHDFLVTENEFIKVGAKLIKEIGAERYLYLLLQNLKGDYVTKADLNQLT